MGDDVQRAGAGSQVCGRSIAGTGAAAAARGWSTAGAGAARGEGTVRHGAGADVGGTGGGRWWLVVGWWL